jgi:hypothetical protein
VIVGVLVLTGEALRRRAQQRGQSVRALADAAIAFAVAYNRLIGERRDAYLAGKQPTDDRAFRYEADSRLFMTPGAEQLQETATALSQAYQEILQTFDFEDHQDSYRVFKTALRAFESDVRSIIKRGRI